jgi:hypothetical protein
MAIHAAPVTLFLILLVAVFAFMGIFQIFYSNNQQGGATQGAVAGGLGVCQCCSNVCQNVCTCVKTGCHDVSGKPACCNTQCKVVCSNVCHSCSCTSTITKTMTTTTTTTTSVPPLGNFDGYNFTCPSFTCPNFSGEYSCELSYTNNLGENAFVVFEFINNNYQIVSNPTVIAYQGTGSVNTLFNCNSFPTGNYSVVWWAYRLSDVNYINPVARSYTYQWQHIAC